MLRNVSTGSLKMTDEDIQDLKNQKRSFERELDKVRKTKDSHPMFQNDQDILRAEQNYVSMIELFDRELEYIDAGPEQKKEKMNELQNRINDLQDEVERCPMDKKAALIRKINEERQWLKVMIENS